MGRMNAITSIDQYKPLLGSEMIERIKMKANKLRGRHVVHVSSTYYGGGVAELLSSLTLLMNDVGIKTGWRVLQGSADFFSVTKKIHNALQGAPLRLTSRKKMIYEAVVFENSVRNHLDHDIVIAHDPQVLPMIAHYKKRGPWIWCCHVDLTNPNKELWGYLKNFIERYDAVIMSMPEYRQKLKIPQLIFRPAIDPFSTKNRPLSQKEISERLRHYHIPEDLPLVVQISRFDRWKDPEGVIRTFKMVLKNIKARLVLLGEVALDDPEGIAVYKSLLNYQTDHIMITSHQDTALVNALQRQATVIVQKSLREGFGLTVTEAMWKKKAVVGGKVGGIRSQIRTGSNGFLVSSENEAARRISELLRNPGLRSRMGVEARKAVQVNYLLPRLLEQYLDLLNSFETVHLLKKKTSVGHG
jgi:trehalose synthase